MAFFHNVAPCKIKQFKDSTQISLMEKYLKNLGQGTNSLKQSKK